MRDHVEATLSLSCICFPTPRTPLPATRTHTNETPAHHCVDVTFMWFFVCTSAFDRVPDCVLYATTRPLWPRRAASRSEPAVGPASGGSFVWSTTGDGSTYGIDRPRERRWRCRGFSRLPPSFTAADGGRDDACPSPACAAASPLAAAAGTGWASDDAARPAEAAPPSPPPDGVPARALLGPPADPGAEPPASAAVGAAAAAAAAAGSTSGRTVDAESPARTIPALGKTARPPPPLPPPPPRPTPPRPPTPRPPPPPPPPSLLLRAVSSPPASLNHESRRFQNSGSVSGSGSTFRDGLGRRREALGACFDRIRRRESLNDTPGVARPAGELGSAGAVLLVPAASTSSSVDSPSSKTWCVAASIACKSKKPHTQ